MLVEATRESGSKETVSNEKDWSLKHFLFLSSSSALLPFHSPSSSPSLPQEVSSFFLSRSFLFWEKPIYSNVHVYMEMNLPASLLFWRFTKTLFPHDTLIRGRLGRWAAGLMIRFWVMEELSGEQRKDRAKVMTSCLHSSSMSFCSLETCVSLTPQGLWEMVFTEGCIKHEFNKK